MVYVLWIVAILLSVGGIVWGAETFAKHMAVAATQLGVSTFALALLLAGAEPKELATAITASVRHAADLKTLTITVHMIGRDKPNVMVFERK